MHLAYDTTVQIDVDAGDLLGHDARIPFVEVSLNLINLDDNMNLEEKSYVRIFDEYVMYFFCVFLRI